MSTYDVTISTSIGITTSLVAWWIWFHVLSPKLTFSRVISRENTHDEPSGFAYRVKFMNPGLHSVIDLTFTAVIRIKGLNPRRPKNYEVTYLPMSFNGEFAYIPPHWRKRLMHLVRVGTDKPKEFERPVYPEEIRSKAHSGTLTLEDLLFNWRRCISVPRGAWLR
jgi:hypothetical protein